jgi:hypothetical protein
MRCLLLVLTIPLWLPLPARSDEATDLRDRAVRAAAKDPADLKKFRVHTIRARGTSKVPGRPLPATFELTAVYPSHLRATWEFDTGSGKNTLTIGASDVQGWKRLGVDQALDMGLEELNDLRTDTYAIWVSTLMTLNEPDVRLAAVGRGKVNGEAVVGLKVSRRPWPDITLWFDERTGLLRKMAYRSRESGAILNKEMIYGGHKEVAGLMVPTTHTTLVDRKEVYTWTEMEYAFPDKIDSKTFAKP